MLPQNLSSTVNTAPGNTYTISGPYVEIEGIIFTDQGAWDDVAVCIEEAENNSNDEEWLSYAAQYGETALTVGKDGSATVGGGVCNNYNFTNNTDMSKFACPISATLLPNKRYVLNIDLSYILTRETAGEYVFKSANINF